MQPHRNAVFATIAFSDAFKRWQANKTDPKEVLIMRFYNEELTDETRQDISGIVDLINSYPTVEQFNEIDARGKRRAKTP